MKLLFIVQRYGREVDGGAELFCRWLCERLTAGNEISVLTTTARDYITWENFYPAGESVEQGVRIIRMPVSQKREIDFFNSLTDHLLKNPFSSIDQENWIRAQGPWSPELTRFLEAHHGDYDLLVFITYLYAPAVLGTRIDPARSILIPTAHNEPVAHLQIFHDLYARIAGIAYLTQPEKDFVESTYAVETKPGILLGTGIELPDVGHFDQTDVLQEYHIETPFIFYMGRIEPGKGCSDLIRYFKAYREYSTSAVSLVLAGRLHMDIPDDSSIHYIGFVPDENIRPILNAAQVIVVPSPYESLSILLLQALACRKPVLANAASPVLQAHCRTSNAGLYYADQEEFISSLDLLLNNPELRMRMGKNGSDYIQSRFTWDRVTTRFLDFCRHIVQSA